MKGRAARAAGATVSLVVLLAALAVAPASAQDSATAPLPVPKRGGGLWVDAGASYAYMRLTSGQNLLNGQQIQGVTYAGGMAVTVSVGGSPAQNVLLGVQGQEFRSAGGGTAQRVRSLLAVVQWYPWAGMGLFARVGTGIVQGPVEPPDTASAAGGSVSGTGVAFALGVGYDFPVSRHFGLTVQAATHINALGDLTRGGQTAYDVIAYVSRIGVAIVYR
jgi:hypothetical protein